MRREALPSGERRPVQLAAERVVEAMAQFAAAVTLAELGVTFGSLADHHGTIRAALDLPITGV